MEEITLFKGLFDLVLWCIIFLVLHKVQKPPYKLKRYQHILGLSLMLLFCLFPFWGGDYYHSRDSFEFIKGGGYNHFEDIYGWIITELCSSYLEFRLIVWGSALAILFYAYKRVGVNYDLSFFYFGALFLVRFSYARASLAMAIILLGMTFIYNPIKKFKWPSYALGVILLFGSEIFHRSALIGIAAALGTLFLIDNKRWKIALIILLLPTASYVMSYIIGNALEVDFDTIDTSINSKLEGYLSRDYEEKGIAAKISNFLLMSPMFLSAITVGVLVFKREIEKFTTAERGYAYYVFIIMLISFGFSVAGGFGTVTLFYRTAYFAMPANAVFIMSLRRRKCEKNLYKPIYILACMYSFYALLYATYMGYNRM